MGVVTNNPVRQPAGTRLWDGIAHGLTICTDSQGGRNTNQVWALPDVVSFEPSSGTLSPGSIRPISGHDASGHEIPILDQFGRRLTGGAKMERAYCATTPPVAFVGNAGLRIRFGLGDGMTNIEHTAVSLFVFATAGSSDISVTFRNRARAKKYQSQTFLADHWNLFSYYDPCNPIDAVDVSGGHTFYVDEFAWDHDAVFDENVVGTRPGFVTVNGRRLVVVPLRCGVPWWLRDIPVVRAMTHRFREVSPRHMH